MIKCISFPKQIIIIIIMKKTTRKILLPIFLFASFVIYSQTTSLMTFNIRYNNPNDNENAWDNRKNEVVDLIEHYHPDFMGIQEGLHDQVQFIQNNTTNYKYIGVGRDDGKTKGEYTALYYDATKFELIKHTTFWLSDTPDKISVGWDASMERISTYGSFKNKTTGKTIHVFNAHFDHRGPKARTMSAKLILKKVKEFGLTNEKVVIMGDLNAIPTSDPIVAFKSGMDYSSEISKTKSYGPVGTFNGFKNDIVMKNKIDYIFTKNLEVLSHRHIDDRRQNNLCTSDHLPVLIEVK